MNASDPIGDETPDRWRCAVAAADTASRWWALAVRTQREKPRARVDQGDLYGLAGELVVTLRLLEDLATVLAHQTATYGQGRVLRDDAGIDPAARLAHAGMWVGELQVALATAQRDANGFWSAIGHIATNPDPDPDPDDRGEDR